MRWRRLLAAVAIPLGSSGGWQTIQFKGIPANKTEFSKDGLKIEVEKSASVLIHTFKNLVRVKSFTADIEFLKGGIKNPPKGWPEDQYLRVGLIVPGPTKLGVVEQMSAAEWLKQLFALMPQEAGLDKVYLFDVAAPARTGGDTRFMPNSKDLFQETISVTRHPGEKQVKLSVKLPRPRLVYAIWLNSDGENSGSTYAIRLKSLKLDVKD